MAGSLNRAMLIGNVGKDPEIRRTQSGDPIANLRIATSESWRDKQSGERVERTEWHTVVCFNENISKVIEQYVKKGSKIFVEGQLQTRKWTDQQGVERYSTEIVIKPFVGSLTLLSDSRRDDDGGTEERQPARSVPARQNNLPLSGGGGGRYNDLDEDEIPF